jgi:hypothetical protein|eukprot:evm.model.NODE_40945_length_18597_cov_30.767275.5
MIRIFSTSSLRLASSTVALVDEPTERVEMLEDVDVTEDWDDAILLLGIGWTEGAKSVCERAPVALLGHFSAILARPSLAPIFFIVGKLKRSFGRGELDRLGSLTV